MSDETLFICLFGIMVSMTFIVLWAIVDCCLFSLKVDYMYKKGRILLNAVCLYNINEIKNNNFDYPNLYEKMDYEKAIKNAPFYYWGYKNFLPEEDLEKVKPFIPQAKEMIKNE